MVAGCSVPRAIRAGSAYFRRLRALRRRPRISRIGPLNLTMDLTQDVVRFGRRRLQLFALECTDGLAGALWRGSRRALLPFLNRWRRSEKLALFPEPICRSIR